MDQLIQGLRRHTLPRESKLLMQCLKGNIEPQRSLNKLDSIFISDTIIGYENDLSKTDVLRTIETSRRRSTRTKEIMTDIRRDDCWPYRFSLDMQAKQITFRLGGSVITIERRKLAKKLRRLKE